MSSALGTSIPSWPDFADFVSRFGWSGSAGSFGNSWKVKGGCTDPLRAVLYFLPYNQQRLIIQKSSRLTFGWLLNVAVFDNQYLRSSNRIS